MTKASKGSSRTSKRQADGVQQQQASACMPQASKLGSEGLVSSSAVRRCSAVLSGSYALWGMGWACMTGAVHGVCPVGAKEVVQLVHIN